MKTVTSYYKKETRLNENTNSSNKTSKLFREPRMRSNKPKLYEGYDEDSFKELYTDREVARVISKVVNTNTIVLIAQQRGNQLDATIEAAADDAGIDAAAISCRDIRENRNYLDELYNAQEDLIVITDLEIADPRMLSALISYMEEREGGIICTTSSPESVLGNPIIDNIFSSLYYYVPQYSRISNYEDDELDESVTERFSKYRKLYEEESLNEDDDKNNDSDSQDSNDDNQDSQDDSQDSNDDNQDSQDDSQDDDTDDTVDVPMTAVVLTVKKEDADKCKDELIEAGIPEDDIEIIEGEEDDEDSQVKVDADSVKELKDYLAGKGIDLEEKIGGTIVDDEESSDEESKDDSTNDSNSDDQSSEDDFNFDDEFGDLFGDDEDSSDEK